MARIFKRNRKRKKLAMSDSNTTKPGPNATVSLREITAATLRAVLRLEVAENQQRFVADNATSIAEAHFEPKAWFRAIYAGETPVGFVMLYLDREQPLYYLWRYMIDRRYQGHGGIPQASCRRRDTRVHGHVSPDDRGCRKSGKQGRADEL